jgi:hypothetical protein
MAWGDSLRVKRMIAFLLFNCVKLREELSHILINLIIAAYQVLLTAKRTELAGTGPV